MRSHSTPTTPSVVAHHVLVLRAIRTLQAQGSPVSLRTLIAVVPLQPLSVAGAVRALGSEGYLLNTALGGSDVRRLTLTMRGFIASHAPSVVAFERRRASRSKRGADSQSTRVKAVRVA